MKNLHNYRQEYGRFSLDETSVDRNPVKQFDIWFKEAVEDGSFEANAVILSTVGKDLKPSSRVVLLKYLLEEGLVFFSNYESKKGKQLAENPQASMLFFWEKLERQVRIEGLIEKVDVALSEDYFNNRPLDSRVGAVASNQSQKIESREVLEQRFAEIKKQREVTRPNHWGGYLLKPMYFEFWQGRTSRLHDRIVYQKEQNDWTIFRIAP